ncbi:MAG: selenium cofactor biosynthesis protein YqeC [Anaerolineaceae bacterium]
MTTDLLLEVERFLGNSQGKSIAIVGAGGKTTLMRYLAHYLKGIVVSTASTKLAADDGKFFDSHFIWEEGIELVPEFYTSAGKILVTGKLVEIAGQDKLSGLTNEQLIILKDYCDQKQIPLIIEADGAKRRPLKAPATWEPVIPEFTDLVIVVVGLKGLMKPLNEENVFRSQIFSQLTGLKMGEAVELEAVLRFLKHPAGGLKGIPKSAKRIVLFILAGLYEAVDQNRISAELSGIFDSVFFWSIAPKES